MLLLSDVEISRLCTQNHLIRPFDRALLSGCSYDLRAGAKLRSRNREQSFDLDKAPYVIESGECVTLTTFETVDLREPLRLELEGETITAYMSALILNKHTILATGLFHPDTSVDPGFRGPLALTLMNFGPIGYSIRSMERIAKIVFVPIIMPVERIYGVTQVPSVREGDTNMALTIDRPEQADSDERLARMYGKPIARLYARMKELEGSGELNSFRRRSEARARRWLIFWTVVAGVLGLIGGIVGGLIPRYMSIF